MLFCACSKTIFVGEYSVMCGGGAVVLASEPRFELHVQSASTELLNIHLESPAGKFYRKYINVFEGLNIEFHDPHNGLGGFGASSAQFVLLYKLFLYRTNECFDIEKFLQEYRSMAAANSKTLPSGSDCVAQYFNRSVWFDGRSVVQPVDIQLPSLAVAVFKTAFKVPTHIHLQDISLSAEIAHLDRYVQDVKFGLDNGDEHMVVDGVNAFFEMLNIAGFVLQDVYDISLKLRQCSAIAAAKGCGALGADTILVLYDRRAKEHMLNAAASISLKPVVL